MQDINIELQEVLLQINTHKDISNKRDVLEHIHTIIRKA
jgi:hypothetical protein